MLGRESQMQHLIIDYILGGEGMHRGYNFTTPTNHIAPGVVQTIWRHAMPRGKGWRDPLYIGAHSLKCIPLPNGRAAISDIIVTDKCDELGRQGIRRAEIDIVGADDYQGYLLERWRKLPVFAREAADRKLGFRMWKRITTKTLPKLKGDAQVILAYPYRNPEDWQVVEAFILKLMLAKRVRLLKGWGKVNPFTTLALDFRMESRLVALPAEKAAKIGRNRKVSVIRIG